MLAGFGPWRGWLLTADLYRRSRSVNTMHYTSVIGGDSATAAALTGEDVASDTISAAHLFPLLPRARCTIPRDAQRRAEPPSRQ